MLILLSRHKCHGGTRFEVSSSAVSLRVVDSQGELREPVRASEPAARAELVDGYRAVLLRSSAPATVPAAALDEGGDLEQG